MGIGGGGGGGGGGAGRDSANLKWGNYVYDGGGIIRDRNS